MNQKSVKQKIATNYILHLTAAVYSTKSNTFCQKEQPQNMRK